jgi:hypothetical protein
MMAVYLGANSAELTAAWKGDQKVELTDSKASTSAVVKGVPMAKTMVGPMAGLRVVSRAVSRAVQTAI